MGGGLFAALDLPLPWMLGAIFGVILASRLPVSLARPHRRFLDPARMILGLAIGSQFSPETIGQLDQYLTSLVFLVPFVALTGLAGWVYFRKVAGLDPATAFLCAMPGGIAELVIVGEEIGADTRKLALVQGIRILVLVYTLPFVAGALADTAVGGGPAVMPGLTASDPVSLALLVLIGAAGWAGFKALGLAGAPIVGPMVVAAGLSMGGILPQSPPDEVFKAAQWMLGASIGGVFIGHSMVNLLGTIWKSIGFLLLLAVATPLFAATVYLLTDFSFVSALLAFAPGGQAEMSLIAIILGENTGYVALHHLFRLILIVSLIPVLARRIFARPG